MIKALEFNQINSEKWDNLLRESTTASFFQTKDCYDFYCRLDFVKSFLFGVEENGILSGIGCGYVVADGGALKKFFSRRAILPGGLLLSNSCSNEALSLLLSTIKNRLKKEAIYIEIRNFNNYNEYKRVFESSFFSYQPHLNVQVLTKDKNLLFSKINKNKLKQVRLSKENGTTCELTKSEEDINKLYLILHELYRKRIKTPLFPLNFFLELVNADFCKIFVVKKDEEILGGIVTVNYKQKIMYEWFICGLDNKISGIYPSTLATYTAIEYASGNGFEIFDFMGAGKPNQKYGVKDFKIKFGGEVLEQGRFLNINNMLLYQIGKFVITILKRK